MKPTTTTNTQAVATRPPSTAASVKHLAEQPEYSKRIKELLGARAPQFVTSVCQIAQGQGLIRQCTAGSLLSSAITAAALDLPANKDLGFAWLVPYKNNRSGEVEAQLQVGYKGYVQLAMRTGQYKFLNVCEVYEGELVRYNKVTGEIEIDPEKQTSDKIIGYAAYFRLLNGAEHSVYWPDAKVRQHAQRYSQSFRGGYDSPWKSDYDKMAKKTVLKDLIVHWGPMSVQLQDAITEDQGAKQDLDSDTVYPDNLAPARAKLANGQNSEVIDVASSPAETTPDDDADFGPTTEAPQQPAEPPAPEKRKPGRPPGSKNKTEPAVDAPAPQPAQTPAPAATLAPAPVTQPAPAPAAPAQPQPPADDADPNDPIAKLTALCNQSGITEEQFVAWGRSRYHLAAMTIKGIYEYAPARVEKFIEQWPSVLADINKK